MAASVHPGSNIQTVASQARRCSAARGVVIECGAASWYVLESEAVLVESSRPGAPTCQPCGLGRVTEAHGASASSFDKGITSTHFTGWL